VSEYRIRAGTATLGIRFLPRCFESLLPEYFRRPSAPATSDFRLSIHVLPAKADIRISDSLFFAKTATAAGFSIANDLVRGRRLSRHKGLEIWVPDLLLSGNMIRIFEQLLYQAFYSAWRVEGADCCLIHSAGIVRGGGGYLFVGPSGSGKTTIAKLSPDGRTLNDEICQLEMEQQSVQLLDTPFNGYYPNKVEGRAPLRAVFLLAAGDAHRILPLARSEAVSGIFQQVVPPVGLDEPLGRKAYERMLQIAVHLVEQVPVYRLEFALDSGFWREIDRTVGKEATRG